MDLCLRGVQRFDQRMVEDVRLVRRPMPRPGDDVTLDLFMTGGASFSDCRFYRYRLWRQWSTKPRWLAICGLNPSTADEQQNDPTIRRCIDFAKQWDFSGLIMVNAFGYRSTDPVGLLAVDDPLGADNDRHLIEVARVASRFIFAWGRHVLLREILPPRADRVFALVREHAICEIGTLGLNGDGSPKHPLYLAKSTPFLPEGRL